MPAPGDHVTTLSVTTVPFTSVTVAVSCVVPAVPEVATESGFGEMRTLATGALVEMTLADPVFPSLVAVIVVAPAVRPETTPVVASMGATAGAVDAHVMTRPVSTLPTESLVTAVRVVVYPRSTVSGLGGAPSPSIPGLASRSALRGLSCPRWSP